MSTAQFYDGLRRRITPCTRTGWHATKDAGGGLARAQPADGTRRRYVVDVACGIGTQLVGLARLGHLADRLGYQRPGGCAARRERDAADVRARLLVADMRHLPLADSWADVVVCADNPLPHLLTDDDVLGAFAEMGGYCAPAGPWIVTTRDS